MNKIAVGPMDTTQEFQLFDTSVSLMVTGSHLPKILSLKLWLLGCQEMLIERHFSIKCTRILKIITRNGLEKRVKMKIS